MVDQVTRLNEAIRQAAGQYYRLVLLAGAPGSGKTATLQAVAQENGCSLLNVNLELSKKMLELTRTQRSRQVERLLKEVIASAPGDVVLLDNLEILFDTGAGGRAVASAPGVEPESNSRRLVERHLQGRDADLRRAGASRIHPVQAGRGGHRHGGQHAKANGSRSRHEVQRSGQVRANRVRHPAWSKRTRSTPCGNSSRPS